MRKKYTLILLALCFYNFLEAQQQWQKLTAPSYSEMRSHFKNYPVEYAESITWGWDGDASRETISQDLDAIKTQGLQIVTIEAGYKMGVPYLSSGWFEKVKIAVDEAKKRNMRIWIIDEGKYPSGFAGGKFSLERPDLRMQGIEIAERISISDGQQFSKPLDPSIISAVSVNQLNKVVELLDISSGRLEWKGKPGNWQIILARHRFKTSVTRAANNPTGGKDTINSLCDYLDPAATKQFLEFTHVQYKKFIGDEFGKTVLGFRGDEPEFNFTPWTPKIIDIFKQKKGYDITPYIASFFTPLANHQQKLAKADYWDVWSDLFRDNFFKVQADWCAANNLEYMVHIDHEDKLMDLAKTEGDYFKDMRYVQIPGVDAIWNQIWYDKVADFPKIASSAAHAFGRPRALSETFAAYNPKPSVEDVSWVINYEMVRGINVFEFMFWPSSASGHKGPSGYLSDPQFPALAEYANRAGYLLSIGMPAAQIGVYMPTESMWLGSENSNISLLSLTKQLLEHQLDFDYVDEQGIGSLFTLENGTFKNLSGQLYSTILIPYVTIMKEEVLKRLQAFAKSGGKVIFLGSNSFLSSAQTFIDAKVVEPFSSMNGNADSLTTAAIKNLAADVVLAHPFPSIKYLHRKCKDADVYFFFNEGNDKIETSVTLNGGGLAENWDPSSGNIIPIKQTPGLGKQMIPLELNPHGTKYIVVKN